MIDARHENIHQMGTRLGRFVHQEFCHDEKAGILFLHGLTKLGTIAHMLDGHFHCIVVKECTAKDACKHLVDAIFAAAERDDLSVI